MVSEECGDNSTATWIEAWMQLMRTYAKLQHCLSAVLEPFDLTMPQMDVLVAIYFHPDLMQQDLAQRLLLSKGNISILVERLQTRGLVQRCADPIDKRVNRLVLTATGMALLQRAMGAHAAKVRTIFATMTPDEHRFFKALLSRIDQGIDTMVHP